MSSPSGTRRTATHALRTAIDQAGYYPVLVADALATGVADEEVVSWVVHHEPHFDGDELRRHVSVMVLTPTRLVVSHTDESPADDAHPKPYAVTSTEAVPLRRLGSVVLSRTVSDPASYRGAPGTGEASEVVLTVGWGGVSRVDLEPASCGDPQCEADHGYSGTLTTDDFSLRVSEAADGRPVVSQLLTFAKELSAATARAGS
jgi:Family of unknown function (DUF5998)